MQERIATITRSTNETTIQLQLTLDGSGKADCNTGVGFFDHMLAGLAKHGLFDLTLTCQGDLVVDAHHTVEDVGIVLGEAIRTALGTKEGIQRYGSFLLPMDEALVLCAIDLSGRPYLVHDVNYTSEVIGTLQTEMLREFFYAVSYSAGINLHLKQISGSNNHHIAEACFKAFAKALDQASAPQSRMPGIWSTKGSL